MYDESRFLTMSHSSSVRSIAGAVISAGKEFERKERRRGGEEGRVVVVVREWNEYAPATRYIYIGMYAVISIP